MTIPSAGALPMDLVRPHQIESLFWVWLLPTAVVLVAALAALAAGRTVDLLNGSGAPKPLQTLRHMLRGSLQALVYVGLLVGALAGGRALGETRGVDAALSIGSAVALLWCGFVTLDAFERRMHERFLRQGRPSAVTVIPLLDKVAKAAWALLISLMFLENMGLDVKTLLAGLGVGGLAVALAGQKTMENLFGGLMLVLDQPVRAGDFCGFGDKSGEVLEVGLRSIKLRTTDRTVITVPNGEFSQLTLENFAKRDRIRFDSMFGLRLDTDPVRVNRVLEALEAVLIANAKVDATLDHYARFVKVGASSLEIEILCYYNGSDWNAFMLWRQSLMLSLLGAMEHEGGRLAFPTQTLVSETTAPPA